MPELPEVESVRRGLEAQVVGKTIQEVQVYWDNIIESPQPVFQFKRRLLGQTIHQVKRRGKLLLFYLDQDVLISHLRMEGKYGLLDQDAPLTKHSHVIFNFRDGTQLRYEDVRKFGRMSLVEKGKEAQHKSLAQLGPEPTSEDLTLEWMLTFLAHKTRAIKSILLDQKLLVGVGNIYADEILFQARIQPDRPGGSLTKKEVETLRQAAITILQEATLKGGSTVRSYKNSLGQAGTYQDFHQVYGKEGELCPRCHQPIKKIKLNGRGTHFCPHCQQ